MRLDIVPGATFPDYVLPHHTEVRRRLSDLRGDDPMVIVLTRGAFCPKDRTDHPELVRFHQQLLVGFTKIVTITTDDWHTANLMRQQLDAHWPFLYDTESIVQKDLDIAEYTDPEHDIMIPHTLSLAPELRVRRVWNGYYYWGRPSMTEVHTRAARGDPVDPRGLGHHRSRAAGCLGPRRQGALLPYGMESMEHTLVEMAGAVDQYAGAADGSRARNYLGEGPKERRSGRAPVACPYDDLGPPDAPSVMNHRPPKPRVRTIAQSGLVGDVGARSSPLASRSLSRPTSIGRRPLRPRGL